MAVLKSQPRTGLRPRALSSPIQLAEGAGLAAEVDQAVGAGRLGDGEAELCSHHGVVRAPRRREAGDERLQRPAIHDPQDSDPFDEYHTQTKFKNQC